MAGEKTLENPEPIDVVMKSEAVPKLTEHAVPSGKHGIASDLTSTISSTPYPSSGTNQDSVGEPGAKQSTGFDNYYYPGYDGSFTQSDDKGYFLSDGSHTVNGSGQFVGLAEMVGKVNFNKDMEFWQLDKWNGFFPLKWHVIKDIPNKVLFHIILENNENKPVTHSRDTQEIGLKRGLEMLNIFKVYSEKSSLLNDFGFYENREKTLNAKKNHKSGTVGYIEGGLTNQTKNNADPAPLINLAMKLSPNGCTRKSVVVKNPIASTFPSVPAP